MKPVDTAEEDAKTEALYKRVRGVLNKLTPQKFSTLVNQVRTLQIDSQEKLQGVINLVFEKASILIHICDVNHSKSLKRDLRYNDDTRTSCQTGVSDFNLDCTTYSDVPLDPEDIFFSTFV